MNFTVTEATYNQIEILRQKRGAAELALKVSVLGGGCSGFRYQFDLVEPIAQDAGYFIFANKMVKVVIDKESALFLESAQIDYVEDLGSASFVITNPNSTARCGCGSSFAI